MVSRKTNSLLIGNVQVFPLFIALLGLAGSVYLIWNVDQERAFASTRMHDMTTQDRSHVESLMARIGIDPSSLAAMGFDSQKVSGLISVANSWYSENGDQLLVLDQQRDDAYQACVGIERSIRRGQREFTLQDRENALQAASQADTAVAAELAAFNESVNSLLTNNQEMVVQTILSNGQWNAETSYRAVTLSESDWVSVINALRCGPNAPASDQAVLDRVRGGTDFVTASANETTYKTSILSAWDDSWSAQ